MELDTHGLSHIHICVKDLPRSLAFYGEFGFIEVGGHDSLHFLVRPGTSDLLTLRVGDVPSSACCSALDRLIETHSPPS